MPSFLFYRWRNWLLQGHTSQSLSLDPKVGLHVGTYRYIFAGGEHIIFLTPIETIRIICGLECSASLIPLSVQPFTRARILLTFRGKRTYLNCFTRNNFSSCLILTMRPNVRMPARQRNAKRAGCSVQHHQIKISTLAKWRTEECAHNLQGKPYLFSHCFNLSPLLEIH